MSAAAPRFPARTILLWLLGACLLAAQLGTDASHGLSVDEAHYALYAYFPDWSYFDHPPLVGWLQIPAVALGGSDLLLRVVPFACWILALVLVAKLTVRLFPGPDAGAARLAAIFLTLTVPMYHHLAMSLHPDTLLLPLTGAVMMLTWRLREPAVFDRPGPWLALGTALGLAGLAKYPAVFLAASAGAALLSRHGTRLLRQRGPWLAAALALLLVSPVFFWNARHHWISFRYQGLHAAGGSAWAAGEVIRVVWSQIKIYGPLTFLAILLALPSVRREPGAVFCLLFALPPAVVIALLAGRGGNLDYWSAFAWFAALPLAGWGLARAWRWRWVKPGLVTLGAVQILYCLLVFARIWSGGAPEGSTFRQNPTADLYGWDKAALRARELALAHGLHSISVMNWTLASRMAWYSRPFLVYAIDPRFDQLKMWYGDLPVGQSTVLVQWSRLPYKLPARPETPRGFARAQFLEEMPVRHGGNVISHFDFYLCEKWDGDTVSAPMPGNWISAY